MWQRFLHFMVERMWVILLNRWFERLISVLGFVVALIIAFGMTIRDLFKPRKQRKAG